LGEVCEISSKLIDPKKSEFQDLIHIGAGNIESRTGTLVDLKTAKEEKIISGKFLFDESMVLYSKIHPYLMKVVRCHFNGLCSADIYPLVPFKNEMMRDFLYYLLITQNFTDYAILGSQRAGMPKVNREHLFAYTLCVPPLIEQQTIVQNLDALSAQTKKLEAIYQQHLNDLDELKKSVLQKAFRGELHSPKGAGQLHSPKEAAST
jgi:type I restriction enzyme S subunit